MKGQHLLVRMYGGPEHHRVVLLPEQTPTTYDLSLDGMTCVKSVVYQIKYYHFQHGRIGRRVVRVGIANGYKPTYEDKQLMTKDLMSSTIQYFDISMLNDFDTWFDMICHKVTGFTYRLNDPLRIA